MREMDEREGWAVKDIAVPRDIVEDLEEEEQSQLEAQLKEAYGQVEISYKREAENTIHNT